MKKKVLDIDTELKVGIIGICSVAKDYRLCWEINRLLKINLTHHNKTAPKSITLENKYRNIQIDKALNLSEVSTFSYRAEEKGITYKLVANANQQGEKLIPEQKQVDFFMLIKGTGYQNEQDRLTKELRQVKIVLTAFEIPANTIKTNLKIFINDS